MLESLGMFLQDPSIPSESVSVCLGKSPNPLAAGTQLPNGAQGHASLVPQASSKPDAGSTSEHPGLRG